MGTFIDLTGERFGRLVAVERAESGICCGKKVTKWKCKCDCGNEVIVEAHSLRMGRTKSCGCFNAETRLKLLKERSTTHGSCYTRLYITYAGMKDRCYNKNCKKYKNYGGRGIKICQEWLDDFLNFKEWTITHGYTDELTIERIDVNGNYCPENCKWIEPKMQAYNKTNSHYVYYKNEKMTVGELAKKTEVPYDFVLYRAYKNMPLDNIAEDYKNRRRRGIRHPRKRGACKSDRISTSESCH